jgi:hypothetical protein
MDSVGLLERAHALGLRVWVEGEQLRVRGHKAHTAVVQELLAHKAEVIALLTPPSTCEPAAAAAPPAACTHAATYRRPSGVLVCLDCAATRPTGCLLRRWSACALSGYPSRPSAPVPTVSVCVAPDRDRGPGIDHAGASGVAPGDRPPAWGNGALEAKEITYADWLLPAEQATGHLPAHDHAEAVPILSRVSCGVLVLCRLSPPAAL